MTHRQRIYYEPNKPIKVGECKVNPCIMPTRAITAFPGQLVRTGAHKKCLQSAGISEKKLARIIEERRKATETT